MFFEASGLWLFPASDWAKVGGGSILVLVITALQRDDGCLYKLLPGEELALDHGVSRVTKSSSQIDCLHLY